MEGSFEAGVALIDNDYIKHVLEYLKTGIFNKPNNATFMTAYTYSFPIKTQNSKVMELADINNTLYPKQLYDHYKEVILDYNAYFYKIS